MDDKKLTQNQRWLLATPVTDVNWKSAAQNSTLEELKEALEMAKELEKTKSGHRTRVQAIERYIKLKDTEKQTNQSKGITRRKPIGGFEPTAKQTRAKLIYNLNEHEINALDKTINAGHIFVAATPVSFRVQTGSQITLPEGTIFLPIGSTASGDQNWAGVFPNGTPCKYRIPFNQCYGGGIEGKLTDFKYRGELQDSVYGYRVGDVVMVMDGYDIEKESNIKQYTIEDFRYDFKDPTTGKSETLVCLVHRFTESNGALYVSYCAKDFKKRIDKARHKEMGQLMLTDNLPVETCADGNYLVVLPYTEFSFTVKKNLIDWAEPTLELSVGYLASGVFKFYEQNGAKIVRINEAS